MRGKVAAAGAFLPGHGITPAYAGKRIISTVLVVGVRDHPRVCGEKYAALLGNVLCLGSPPRMRGKDGEDDNRPQPFGITPAYAGKSV